jgi:hypothetical protein
MTLKLTSIKLKNCGRPQIKSNDPWQKSNLIKKIVKKFKSNEMTHKKPQLVLKNCGRSQMK